jgi:hypothetical protein
VSSIDSLDKVQAHQIKVEDGTDDAATMYLNNFLDQWISRPKLAKPSDIRNA